MGTEIIGYIVAAWFIGMLAADSSKPNLPIRKSRETIYQYREIDQKKVIVSYKAFGQSTCRPQCYMSGTFFDGIVRPMKPWPFRRGKYFECAREGELDYCTGEVYLNKKWIALKDNMETPYFGKLEKAP